MRANHLVPELSVSNFAQSLDFYTRVLGFSIVYQRAEEGFAFLALHEAQIMIDAIDMGRTWKTAALEYPLGRGVNFAIAVASIQPLLERLRQHTVPLFLDVEEKWYRKHDVAVGQKQFAIQDPDGYLLRFTEDLGEGPILPLA